MTKEEDKTFNILRNPITKGCENCKHNMYAPKGTFCVIGKGLVCHLYDNWKDYNRTPEDVWEWNGK